MTSIQATPTFVHLNLHSEFSLVDGIVRIPQLLQRCQALAMPAVAITDATNLFGTVKFFKRALKHGIKPIIGADLKIYDASQQLPASSMIFLCQNHQGYLNLISLVSDAYVKGIDSEQRTVDKEWVVHAHQGLIVLDGGISSQIGQALLADNQKLAEQLCQFWIDLVGDRFYLTISRLGREQDELYHQQIILLAKKMNCPLVATNEVRFLDNEDFEAHETRVCIQQGCLLEDKHRPRDYTQEQYLKSSEEMQRLFSDIPSALQNTVEIARRCSLLLPLGKTYLPDFPVPSGQTIANFLSQRAEEGLAQRLTKLFAELPKQTFDAKQAYYQQRLQRELKVINNMGFPGYFLIVADFIQWAKNHQVPVGPGRGSGAGSLVAYALQITNLDPIAYDLLFERFLNPERVSMPDFDIDFCMEGRDRVIDYVADRYGRHCVSQIITFGTMAAKAVVRDVGRVLGHPYGFVDKLAKLIPFEIGMTLSKALEQEPLLKTRYDSEEDVHGLLDLALKLEGITRNAGKHAGGLVIAPSKLTDYSPVYCESSADHVVTQFDKDDVEAIGLVKFDFLGLRTLTIIQWALEFIESSTGLKIDIDTIALDCERTFELLKKCQTTAVFQLESRGMKELIHRLQPDCFEDIIALVALFRPGPLQSGMVDDFIDRKHGRAEVSYPHPKLSSILAATYGVILYQEQVMQIAQDLAGYTLGAADLLRRAMGKKKPEEMAKQRHVFLQGAIERHVDEAVASHIFDLMEKFAGYGFNKSHSAAYAMVSYQTAWLKAHYPAAFMAAVMSSDMDHTDKIVSFIDECRELGLLVLPPDINNSMLKFTPADSKRITYGLVAIKGVGEAAVEAILAARTHPYQSLADMLSRVNLKKINRRMIEALIYAGAFDKLSEGRAHLLHSIDHLLKQAEKLEQDKQRGQIGLFNEPIEQTLAYDTIEVAEWPLIIKLKHEKATLGWYVSGHPTDTYKDQFSLLEVKSVSQLTLSSKQHQRVLGLLTDIRHIMTKHGKRMMILRIEDNQTSLDAILFPEQFDDVALQSLVKHEAIIISGEVNKDNFSGRLRIVVDSILSLTEARIDANVGIHLTLTHHDQGKLEQLSSLLRTFKGTCGVTASYTNSELSVRFSLSDQFHILPDDKLLCSLQTLLGVDHVRWSSSTEQC